LRLPYELHLALRYTRFHRGRTSFSLVTLISVAGVAVGTAALVIALALMTGFQQDLRERVLGGTAHLTVFSLQGADFDLDETIATIESVPGVAAVGAVMHSDAMVTTEDAGRPTYAQIHGVDAERHEQVVLLGDDQHPLETLRRSTLTGRQGIVLGDELAASLRVQVGDAVRVLVPSMRLTPFGPLPRSRVFEVVGLFHTGSFFQDSQRAYVTLASAGRLLGPEAEISWIELRTDNPGSTEGVKTGVVESLAGSWLVLDMLEQNKDFVRALNTEKRMLFLAIGLIVIVAALNIGSTLILMVTDKVKEIGTLSAMGARPRGIAVVFMLQGVIIGSVGTVLGLLLGAGISRVLDHFQVIKLDPEVYFLFYVPFVTSPGDLIFAGLLALGVSYVATLYPAWKAATLDPVEAIRHE
jgi:lipoprotein-releasing system permease protein